MLDPAGLEAGISFNKAIGNYTLICGSVKHESLAGIKAKPSANEVADILAPHGMRIGYHSHKTDHPLVDGVKPMDVLMDNTDERVITAASIPAIPWTAAPISRHSEPLSLRCQTIHMKPHRWLVRHRHPTGYWRGRLPWRK